VAAKQKRNNWVYQKRGVVSGYYLPRMLQQEPAQMFECRFETAKAEIAYLVIF
jgi:hypothetical protein